jgi:hypothetical protein
MGPNKSRILVLYDMPSKRTVASSDRYQSLVPVSGKTHPGVFWRPQLLLSVSQGLFAEVSGSHILILVPLITDSPSGCTTQYPPPSSSLTRGHLIVFVDCAVFQGFPTGALKSGEQLTAALIRTRLPPSLHHFNASFYAGIWGCVCLQAICNETKRVTCSRLGGGARTPGKTGPFTGAALGSRDRAAALGCLRHYLISCEAPHGFSFQVLWKRMELESTDPLCLP